MTEGLDDSTCRDVVLHAYQGLRETAIPTEWAFEIAIKIYQYYHPKAPLMVAENAVAGYLAETPSPPIT